MVTIYQADVWCDDCGVAILDELLEEGCYPSYWTAEERENVRERRDRGLVHLPRGYDADSDDWPSIDHPPEPTDCPQHCAAQEECFNAEVLPSGRKIGKLLGDELTPEGQAYVKEAIAKGGEVAEFWKENLWIEE